ncbi:MAG: aminoglycoside 6'-N-acetyltransferase, partial [Pyrinomonadaceae bacterium]
HQARATDFERWQSLRRKLWAHTTEEENREFFDDFLTDSDKLLIVVAESEQSELAGFLEAGIRQDYVEGCDTERVGYIEGWFVEADFRRQHVGRQLVEFAENWARELGCEEMASDCDLENDVSLNAHLGVGYAEVGRSIHFKKWL